MDELEPMIRGERTAFAHRCHERDISMSHLHLMSLLESRGPLPMGRVAELLGVGEPTVSGLVSRMEERGLVQRVRTSEDRRVVLLELSADGADQLRELQLMRRSRMATAIADLDPAQREALLSSIRALRQAFVRLTPEGAPAP